MTIAEKQNAEGVPMQYTQSHHNVSLAELDHQDTLTQDFVNPMDVTALTKQEYRDEYCDSLEVFCQKRISSTHQALQQVTYFSLNSFLHKCTGGKSYGET